MEPKNAYRSNLSSEEFSKNQNSWIIGCSIAAFIFLALHFLLELKTFQIWDKYLPILKKLTLSVFFIFIVLLIGKFIEKLIAAQSRSIGHRYNLIRITRLLTTLFILILVASFLLQDLYAAAYSFGIITLVLGFALQSPITSFIGWLYLVFRTPYKVGDRIQMGKFRGDVTEITYLDTVLLEFSGEYLQNDRSTGRVIHFPNSNVLRMEVFNYSGPSFPFIWNETAIQVAYHSDIEFVQDCLLQAAIDDFETRYPQYSPEKELPWKPDVYFRNSRYAWLEAVISYPVRPTETTPRRTGHHKTGFAKNENTA